MCCKAFAICVREAATIVADRHGWCLLEVGSSPMRHLSKLELDTKLVLSFLRDQTTCWWTRWRIQLVDLWTDEVNARFIGALFIDPQVLRQHTAELGRYLIKLAMDVCPDDPMHDFKMTKSRQAAQMSDDAAEPIVGRLLVAGRSYDSPRQQAHATQKRRCAKCTLRLTQTAWLPRAASAAEPSKDF